METLFTYINIDNLFSNKKVKKKKTSPCSDVPHSLVSPEQSPACQSHTKFSVYLHMHGGNVVLTTAPHPL